MRFSPHPHSAAETMEEPDLELVRNAVCAAIEARSLRSVARSIGMSPGGVTYFTEGAKPYLRTRRNLCLWYLRTGQSELRSTQEMLIDQLVASVPEFARDEARHKIRAIVDAGVTPNPPAECYLA